MWQISGLGAKFGLSCHLMIMENMKQVMHSSVCLCVCVCEGVYVCMIYGVEDSEYILNTLPVVD